MLSITTILYLVTSAVTLLNAVDYLFRLLTRRSVSRRRKLAYVLTLTLCAGAAILFALYDHLTLFAGQTYSDDSLSIRVPSMMRGSFLNPRKYDLQVEVTNRLAEPIFVEKIVGYFFNPNVRELAGMLPNPDGSYFRSEYGWGGGTGMLPPNSTVKYVLPGPYFIPRDVKLVIRHSGSTTPTECAMTVTRERDISYWTKPRHINVPDEAFGMDGIDALRKALPVATDWNTGAQLVLCSPTSNRTTYLGNGLQIASVSQWALLFKHPDTTQEIWAVVNPQKVSRFETSTVHGPNSEIAVVNQPIRVGMIEALRSVDRHSLVYGNNVVGWMLVPYAMVNGRKTTVWVLPYAGKDYRGLFVDVSTGNTVKLDGPSSIIPRIAYTAGGKTSYSF